jgi:hypothetical protein
MFGHNHISEDDEIVAQADFFESFQKQVAMARAAEQRPPLITTAGDEMQVIVTVVAADAGGHERKIDAGIAGCL